jgi:hypothetical protein
MRGVRSQERRTVGIVSRRKDGFQGRPFSTGEWGDYFELLHLCDVVVGGRVCICRQDIIWKNLESVYSGMMLQKAKMYPDEKRWEVRLTSECDN